MPNGYTSDIYEGKEGWDDLRSYLMGVGRGMSMAIMQRDEDPSEPVRYREISTYSKDRLAEASAEVKRLEAQTADQMAVDAEEAHAEAWRLYDEAQQKKLALVERYDAMIAKVEAWEPDPLVQYVKDHALNYLRESKEFDCGGSYPYQPDDRDYEPQKWHDSMLDKARHDVEYHSKEYQKEVERVAGFNLHIDAFNRSLPAS